MCKESTYCFLAKDFAEILTVIVHTMNNLSQKWDIKSINHYQKYCRTNVSKHWFEQTLTKHDIKHESLLNREQRFKIYANNLKLVNKHFQDKQGPSMLVHQKSILSGFLQEN